MFDYRKIAGLTMVHGVANEGRVHYDHGLTGCNVDRGR
jgi:hypothetical protein